MSTGIKVATRIQIGVESTRGTAVNATRKLLGKSFTYRYMETFEEFEEQISGVLVNSAQAPVLTRNGTEFEMAIDLDFEQILLPLLSGSYLCRSFIDPAIGLRAHTLRHPRE